MWDVPTRHYTYEFPLDSIRLKYQQTGGYVDAEIVQLTKLHAYLSVDLRWRRFRGPFCANFREPDDGHWSWGRHVRRLRKNVSVRCAGTRTADGRFQGAIIYRRDGNSLLQENTPAVYVEYLATAPCNRRDYAAKPEYLGVGEGLMQLAILQSYDWGFGGRVALFSLPRSLGFYKRLNFVETGDRIDRMIGCELTPEVAVKLLEDKGLI